MKIHRISPETLITLILAHLAGKAESTTTEEHGYSVGSFGMMTAGWPAYC